MHTNIKVLVTIGIVCWHSSPSSVLTDQYNIENNNGISTLQLNKYKGWNNTSDETSNYNRN